MKCRRIIPDLNTSKIEESKAFYVDFIGLKLAVDMDWIVTFISESNPTAQINILRSDQQNIRDNSNVMISIESSNVDDLYQKAIAQNMEITYPLKIEDWGVKRFFVKDPNGVTVNVMCHVNGNREPIELVKDWFDKWTKGDYFNLPIAENFKHTSPFGIIEGKKVYMDLVKKNEAQFLGQTFEILDSIYEKDRACVCYTAKQGKDFTLDVSEWYYMKDNLIEEIIAYYHIGEIREERQLENPNDN